MRTILPILVLLAAMPGASAADWTAEALQRSKSASLGLPAPVHPTHNPPTIEKIALGRKPFFDRRISFNGTMSCAMCYVPEQAFANNELATAVGVEGRSGKRNAPSLLNVAYMEMLFHDGREAALETQYVAPLLAHNEMAAPSIGYAIGRIRSLPDYAGLFEAAFDAPAGMDTIGMALGAYQRTLITGPSAFDRWRYGGAADAIGEDARRGFALFTGRAGCATCHHIRGETALFTDQALHDIGYGYSRERQRTGGTQYYSVEVAPGVVHQVKAHIVEGVGQPKAADLGRYEVINDPADLWQFRTPSLRNVALSAPYMHDGGLARLEDVIAFYNGGGAPHDGQDPAIRPLGLNAQEIGDLAAFLRSLTGSGVERLIAEGRSSPPDNE